MRGFVYYEERLCEYFLRFSFVFFLVFFFFFLERSRFSLVIARGYFCCFKLLPLLYICFIFFTALNTIFSNELIFENCFQRLIKLYAKSEYHLGLLLQFTVKLGFS